MASQVLAGAGPVEVDEEVRQRVREAGQPTDVEPHLIVGRNNYPLGLLNGSRGTITSVDRRRSRVTIETTEGRTVEVPKPNLAAGHLAHGYATTVHKAQGATVDTALILIDDQSYREAAYTGLSRGRIANRVYVISDDAEAIEAHGLKGRYPTSWRRFARRFADLLHQELASRSGPRRGLGR